jgi:hypothetical protein
MPGWVPIDGNMDRGANGDNSKGNDDLSELAAVF